jgi:hypothetical protein
MTRRFSSGALMLVIAAVVLVLISCSTPQTRISDHPDLYQSLSSRDQALVSQGQIRSGMSRSAVWLAWGSPDQKIVGNIAGGRAGVAVAGGNMHHHGGRSFVFFGSPFYDPFYWSYIPPSIPYPGKVVTFVSSRVMSFQYLASN